MACCAHLRRRRKYSIDVLWYIVCSVAGTRVGHVVRHHDVPAVRAATLGAATVQYLSDRPSRTASRRCPTTDLYLESAQAIAFVFSAPWSDEAPWAVTVGEPVAWIL